MIEIYAYGLVNSVLVFLLWGIKRVFEVIAKFSQDALPGKLISIDYDKKLDDDNKQEMKKLLHKNLEKVRSMATLSRITYYFFLIETILVIILLIIGKKWQCESETSIFVLMSISTVIHICACTFFWIKYMKYRSIMVSSNSAL